MLYDSPAPFPRQGLRPGSRTPELRAGARGARRRPASSRSGRSPGSPGRSCRWPSCPARRRRRAASSEAILEWAQELSSLYPFAWPRNPAIDVLRRIAPRTRDGVGGLAPLTTEHDYVRAVIASLRGARRLLPRRAGPSRHRQDLRRVARHHRARRPATAGASASSRSRTPWSRTCSTPSSRAGLDPDLVAKAPKDAREPGDHGYTIITKDGVAEFTAAHAASGFVVGGTAWDFANADRVPRRSLDLLVIDEAGQFSLASTIAVERRRTQPAAARRPAAAAAGEPGQPPRAGRHVGARLGRRRRTTCCPPSTATSSPRAGACIRPSPSPCRACRTTASCTRTRRLAPLARRASRPASRPCRSSTPATPPRRPRRRPRSSSSSASCSVATWVDATDAAARRPPARSSATSSSSRPYNAQLTLVRAALDAAGFTEVPVGTVDKFQGQEAAVAIVSLAASSAAAAPRGVEFLLLKNRLNVAISRAKWAAYLDLLARAARRPAAHARGRRAAQRLRPPRRRRRRRPPRAGDVAREP